MNPNAELTLFSTHAQTAGFRLQRFEAFNWGTFHQNVCLLPLAGENALLTGANGAGKTTLVDAIIALLNPTPERYFNQSAGIEDRRRTRRTEDYARGVYGHSQDGREQLRDLPGEAPTYSVLLGVFYNDDLQQTYSLAHLYWFKNGELQKRFYTAPKSLYITTHFNFNGDIRTFNAHLTKTAQATNYDSFAAFAADFQPKLGMRQPEKANNSAGRTKPLHLLAKTAGIKVLGNLDGFIREQMLDESSMDEAFDKLKKGYTDIAETQLALEKLAQQEQMLMPLLDKNTARLTCLTNLAQLETVQAAVGPWFAQQHVALLETAVQHLQNEQERLAYNKDAADSTLENLAEKRTQLKVAIEQNDQGKRMAELQREKGQLEQLLAKQQKDAGRYASIAQSLGLVTTPDAALFFAQREKIQALGAELLEKRDEQDQKRTELEGARRDKQHERAALENEIQSLQKRRNNLPSELIECRTRLVQAIGCDERELPFVGELMQVRAEERATWEHALEKLARPFTLYLLVPPKHLREVVKWVRRTNTGVLLRFVEADDHAPEFIPNDHGHHMAANKLEVKTESPFAPWLQKELAKRFPHQCTEDGAEYERLTRALTPEGLYKSDKQHQKDDRKQRFTYVMGWDNAEKMAKLRQEAKEVERELEQLAERLLPIRQKTDHINEQLANLKRLDDFDNFHTIDVPSTLARIQEVVAEIEDLSQASSEVNLLKKQLDQTEKEEKTAQKNRDDLIREQARLEKTLEERLAKLQMERLNAQAFAANSSAQKHLLEHLGDLPELDLETIGKIEQAHKSRLNQQIGTEKGQIEALKRDMERGMKDFKQPSKAILDQFPTWPNDTEPLGSAEIDNISDYLALLERIQSDQLPELRERFQTRTNQDIGNEMRVFQRYLEDQFDDHVENIRNINQALRALPYSQGTYLKVEWEDRRKKGRIGEFYRLLTQWDYDRAAFYAASDMHKIELSKEMVQRIGALIDRLEKNEPWRKEVMDVRNWLGFKTQQYYREHDTPVSGTLLEGTGGKSGGEQAKLTYTVLAAALTYQFNIGLGERNARSFRFIVVDEAFSKLDPENSTYLLELLTKLRFQMLIITPLTGIGIVEKYVSHLIHVIKERELPPLSVAHCFSVKEKAVPIETP